MKKMQRLMGRFIPGMVFIILLPVSLLYTAGRKAVGYFRPKNRS